MGENIFVTADGKNDNIYVYHQEPAEVVMANREDINSLTSLEEANLPGIYILIGDNRRYIGQAATSVISRLSQHHKDKDWWTNVIFFGREDGHLAKSQTDYLEKKLIDLFQQTTFDIDNSTQGNQSYIDKLSKAQADNLWSIVQEILLDVVNIDLFENENQIVDENTDQINCYVIKDNQGNEFSDSSMRSVFVKMVTNYYNSFKDQLSKLIVSDKPTTINILGTKESISKSGYKLTREISDGIFLYVNFSKQDIIKKISYISDILGIKITCNF
ncbi:GIY-YIG nuclease family protein [Companilactobacillus metriopterae]|uniref:GIY-YIG nuclease family protein n=1 Tax=Companilactobacillus metriopterae TaxID=1909267 RepID=UPI00100AFD3C|nr:GIY-YIG nuclease family protein [Companilactobacillus metriopterae]